MSIFDSAKLYGGKWSVKSVRNFTEDEVNAIKSAKVVDSDYGLSACFMLKSGYTAYYALSSDSSASINDTIDVSKAEILTLERAGDNDITRVRI